MTMNHLNHLKVFGFVAFALLLAPTARAASAQEVWNAVDKAAKARLLADFRGGFANYWHTNIDAAREMYESVLTNELCGNVQKIDALRQVAQMHLEATRDTEAALAAMERAFALPGLTDAERARADAAKLDLLRAMRLAPPDPAKVPKAKSLDELEQAARLCDKLKKCPIAPSVNSYFDACLDGGYDVFFDRVPRMLKEFDKAYPQANYWPIALGVATSWYRLRSPSKAQRDRRFAAALVSLVESAPAGRAPAAEALFAYAGGKPALDAKCRGYAAKVVERSADPALKISPQTVAAAKKFLLFDAAGSDVAKIVSACRECLAQEKKQDDKAALAKLLGERASRMLLAGDESVARRLWDERLKIAPEKPQSKLGCPYWKDAPHDVRGVVESDFYRKAPKGLFAHRYGDNLKFLIETDSAITSREMTTDNGEKFRPTELFAFCDAQGVKLLLRAFPGDMAGVKAGTAGVPGYEAYLATGVDDPYHCLMLDASEGGKPGDGFVTQYDNGTGYRQLTRKEGSLKFDNLYFDDGVATLFTIPWTATFAATPWQREAWYFEPIHWAHGGLSWGGSKSVHHRSSFGKLHFTGGDAKSYAAVKRTLLPAAKAKFAASCNARAGGETERWKDPELGDQAFYLAKVKPLVERIQPMMDLVKSDMSDEDATKAWDAAGEDAMNIDFIVSRLRTKWLDAKRLGERVR